MTGSLFGYARVTVASDGDANNQHGDHRRFLADCEQIFGDVGSGASWNRFGVNRLRAALQPRQRVKVAALDRLIRSLTEVMKLLNWLRERDAEFISPLVSIDQESAMGRTILRLSIVFAKKEHAWCPASSIPVHLAGQLQSLPQPSLCPSPLMVSLSHH